MKFSIAVRLVISVGAIYPGVLMAAGFGTVSFSFACCFLSWLWFTIDSIKLVMGEKKND